MKKIVYNHLQQIIYSTLPFPINPHACFSYFFLTFFLTLHEHFKKLTTNLYFQYCPAHISKFITNFYIYLGDNQVLPPAPEVPPPPGKPTITVYISEPTLQIVEAGSTVRLHCNARSLTDHVRKKNNTPETFGL